jgi:hypothetical protein
MSSAPALVSPVSSPHFTFGAVRDGFLEFQRSRRHDRCLIIVALHEQDVTGSILDNSSHSYADELHIGAALRSCLLCNLVWLKYM